MTMTMTTVEPRATIGGALVEDFGKIRRTMTDLTALDTTYGSVGLDIFAVRAFTSARVQLATVGGPDRLGVDLADMVAQLGHLAAWLLHDADRDDDARTVLVEALAIAGTARSRRTRLAIVDQLSMLAAWSGDWADALSYADRGLALAGATSPHIAATFRIRRGRALALAGDPEGLDELHRASAAIDGHGRHDPPWTLWLTPSDLAMHHALAASDLGHHADAVDLARWAVASVARIRRRDRTMFRVHQLHIAIAAGAWTEATDTANGLVAPLRQTGSARAARTALTLAANLPETAPPVTTSAVETVGEAARNALVRRVSAA